MLLGKKIQLVISFSDRDMVGVFMNCINLEY